MKTALLVVALASSAPRPAHAEEMLRTEQIPDKARQLAEKGRAYHEAGDYPRAIAAFKEAYVLAPSPGLLFNLAQAYRLAGNCDDAAWMYHRYLDTNPPTDRRAVAETHLAAVEKCGHGLLKIAIVPQPVESKLPEPTIAAEPQITVRRTPIELAPQNTEEKVGLTLGVGGGVLLAGAAWFAYEAWDASNQVSDLYKNGGKGSQVTQLQRRGESDTTYAEWLGAGGALAAAAGVALYLDGRASEQVQHVAVAPTSDGARVSVSWRF